MTKIPCSVRGHMVGLVLLDKPPHTHTQAYTCLQNTKGQRDLAEKPAADCGKKTSVGLRFHYFPGPE